MPPSFVGLHEVSVSLHTPVGSLHGSCRIYHFDLRLSLILLFKSYPHLDMFSDLHLIRKCAVGDQWMSVLVSCWEMDVMLAPACILHCRDQCVYFMGHCFSPQNSCGVSSQSHVLRLCCFVLGCAFKLQDF